MGCMSYRDKLTEKSALSGLCTPFPVHAGCGADDGDWCSERDKF